MMGKQNGQLQMIILDIDSMIPENHLLRQIKKDLLTNPFFILNLAYFLLRSNGTAGKNSYSHRFYQPFEV